MTVVRHNGNGSPKRKKVKVLTRAWDVDVVHVVSWKTGGATAYVRGRAGQFDGATVWGAVSAARGTL